MNSGPELSPEECTTRMQSLTGQLLGEQKGLEAAYRDKQGDGPWIERHADADPLLSLVTDADLRRQAA
jgi:hypothetical protein